MAKGYWIAHVDVTDMDAYQEYVRANAAAFSKYNARFLTRGGAFEAREGAARSRHVIIEFPDYQAALDCYDSPEYQHAKSFRTSASEGEIIVLEGYDGPQPGD